MPVSRIEALVRESERWVLRKIEEWKSRKVPPIVWEDGVSLPYLGGLLRLNVIRAARAGAQLDGGRLCVTVRSPVELEVRRVVVAWYKRVALEHLRARVESLAARAGLAAPRVLLSSAMARWGSCNSRREVRLAWRLVKAAPVTIDYVVCHELAHLRHMNHSRAFWAEVERQCPAYRELREGLFATDHLYRTF
jgi:predicted metal-dependent hydrolase